MSDIDTTVVDSAALTRWVTEFARLIGEQHNQLTDLDAAIGDADHGTNMSRGMSAVLAALPDPAQTQPAVLLKKVASTLISSVGGASGPLYGTFFLRMATATGLVDGLDGPGFAKALRAGVDGVVARGKAELGDKTMFDALSPAVAALDDALAAGSPLADALRAAAAAAADGRDATTPLVARKGRASYLGERSAGHQDPGATSAALLVAATSALTAPGAGG
ncbi:MAG: phosphoenolpyruvate---glycerone phosphotransferase subunit DhaL [Pseudonocardiales bacterium]|jgi:dihydroxyacetone kinase-like protein|nr:phosphoenolpyruvate---glycerone phosphotransferase subunit DhaL [Pseudonocardiales bacterium]